LIIFFNFPPPFTLLTFSLFLSFFVLFFIFLFFLLTSSEDEEFALSLSLSFSELEELESEESLTEELEDSYFSTGAFLTANK
jgi:hypothetical protein